jgi:hypothetical protein
MGDLFYFGFHIPSQLTDAHYFRNHIGFAMQLQMLTDALGAKQLNALHAHVPDYFRGVSITVVAGD